MPIATKKETTPPRHTCDGTPGGDADCVPCLREAVALDGWNDRIEDRGGNPGKVFLANSGEILPNDASAERWTREERESYVAGWQAADRAIAGLRRAPEHFPGGDCGCPRCSGVA